MIDVNAMAKALGGDGIVNVETPYLKGSLQVFDGQVSSSITLKRAINTAVIEEAIKQNAADSSDPFAEINAILRNSPGLTEAVFGDLKAQVDKGGCWYRRERDGSFTKMKGGDHWPATMGGADEMLGDTQPMPLNSESMFALMSSAARDGMMQLFVTGPTWDGNVISKSGRDELVSLGLAFHVAGWASLSEDGVRLASVVDVSGWADQRWYRKQRQL